MDLVYEDERTELDGADAALEVMLLLADADARWGDHASAVRVLDMAARATGGLPLEYEAKRARWAWLGGLGHRPSLS